MCIRDRSTRVKCVAKRDRFIVLSTGDVVYVNVHFPVKKSYGLYKNELICFLWDIAGAVAHDWTDKVVLGSDFNFQCDELSTGFSLLKKCLKDLDLVSCDSVVQSPADSLFTYSHLGMAKGSFIDHFCVTRNLLSYSHCSRDH